MNISKWKLQPSGGATGKVRASNGIHPLGTMHAVVNQTFSDIDYIFLTMTKKPEGRPSF